jgi:hypothetical protein
MINMMAVFDVTIQLRSVDQQVSLEGNHCVSFSCMEVNSNGE